MIRKSVRIEVPIFEGSRNPKDYTDWESDLESYFQWYDMDDDLCVAYAEARHGALDPSKIDAIVSWPKLKSIHDVRSFIGLATFYRRFILGFSGIMTPITDILKGEKFEWTSSADQTFELLKKHMTEAPVLKLPDFNKVFEAACDASGVGIGGVLSQEGHPIEYFNEKLNDTWKRYDNYDREFYTLVQSLRH
ncbi:putative mitochondrial protein AtMg00860 [Wolffia australiana]